MLQELKNRGRNRKSKSNKCFKMVWPRLIEGRASELSKDRGLKDVMMVKVEVEVML